MLNSYLLIFLTFFSCQLKKENNSTIDNNNKINESNIEAQDIEFLDCDIKDTSIIIENFE